VAAVVAGAILILALVWIFSGNDNPAGVKVHLASSATGPALTPPASIRGNADAASSSPAQSDSVNLLPTSLMAPGTGSRVLNGGATGLDCLIEPNLTVEVATSASGILKEIRVDRGYLIKKGEILAILENEVEKANVAHARARVEFATKKFRRMEQLQKEQMVSMQQLDEAKAEHDLAVAEYQKAAELLRQRTITSPLSGVVVEKFVSVGEMVENKKIVKVAQVDPLNVEIIAPVSMIGGFSAGARVLVFPEGPVQGPLEASVKLVDRVVDAPSGTFRVRLELPNAKSEIPAGVRCRAKLANPTDTAKAMEASLASPAEVARDVEGETRKNQSAPAATSKPKSGVGVKKGRDETKAKATKRAVATVPASTKNLSKANGTGYTSTPSKDSNLLGPELGVKSDVPETEQARSQKADS